ncbi:MAG: hypothetical protein ACRDBP_08720 [Luteolibacter sp.]
MKFLWIALVLLGPLTSAAGGTVHVTVGDTGCPGRQIGVTRSWEKIPGVVSVTVRPRDPKDPAAQRVFVIVSKATPPPEDSLREALGRRVERYPILKYTSEPAPVKE